MSRNLSVFYVNNYSEESVELDDLQGYAVTKLGTMWLRFYRDDGTAKILKLTSDLDREGIESDEDYLSLVDVKKLIPLEVPFFIVNNNKEELYSIDEVVSFVHALDDKVQ